MALPTQLIAGDSAEFTFADDSYPSSDWSLTAYIIGPSALTVSATPEADESFTVTLTAAQTATLKAGLHNLTLRATYNSDVKTLATGVIDVRANPALTGTSVVYAQQMVTLIERALNNQLKDGEGISSLSIGGRSLTSLSRPELIDERNYWIRELKAYKNAQTGNNYGLRSIALNVGRLS